MPSRAIKISSITLKSGASIDVANGITAIVGPNNVGKSSLLRELVQHLGRQAFEQLTGTKVVAGYEASFSGDFDAFLVDLKEEVGIQPPGQYSNGLFTEDALIFGNGTAVPASVLASSWGSNTGLGMLNQYFTLYLNADSRLALTADTNAFDSYSAKPSNPLQQLWARPDLERSVDALSRRAFNSGVTVNRVSGSMIHLHAGSTRLSPGGMPASMEYQREINGLPLVHEQGDGMRALVGMAMSIVAGQAPLILIDEPEAFLHPPQARVFGKFLAEQRAAGSQVIVATHSQDVLSGLTSVATAADDVSVARLTRHEDKNYVAQVPASDVRVLFDDPLIKYYDMLNGLFSTAVVVCEADGDCTYYRAVVESSPDSELQDVRGAHFTHAGGKSRISKAIRTFRAARVPAVAIFDIDVLRDDSEFEAIVLAAGGDPKQIEGHRNSILTAVNAGVQKVKRVAAKAEIDEIFQRSTAREISTSHASLVRDAVTAKSGWKIFKRTGKSMLSGEVVTSYEIVASYLESLGIFVLEQGELERLHQNRSQSDKSLWLREVLANSDFASSPALQMLKRVSSFIAEAQVAPGEV